MLSRSLFIKNSANSITIKDIQALSAVDALELVACHINQTKYMPWKNVEYVCAGKCFKCKFLDVWQKLCRTTKYCPGVAGYAFGVGIEVHSSNNSVLLISFNVKKI